MKEKKIEVINVTKKIGRKTILENISFTVFKGEISALIGPNGAGKTTLIRMLTGLIDLTDGEIFICGNSIIKDRKNALKKLGAIVEAPIFFPYMTGRKLLQNLARLHNDMSRKEQLDKVEEVLELVGLRDRGDDKVKTYSLGMKQRLGIAQALLGNPDVIILDEPSNGLDPLGMKQLRELIKKLRDEKGVTFLISSHLLDELQLFCDKFIIINNGKVIWEGTKEELITLTSGGNRIEDAFIELIKVK
ncbi:ABC transporter ATP-binding protein [Caloranaerobacter azorensis H53214]|uniref:ABC transporter ATP-binding protein n=1 Tax=Caloranaerobacter azorensis H53214 TaxID=1156417 RepID=A0A096BFV5_9FIRM|nr:ATP-binding cassette domain-containing protein [Caloranaerobacter azorensis]KGG79588.1 ABC transporter ATP-binding protein [Caloranaerobacter azorensis H53214]